MKYYKLVRDKIPEILKQKGEVPVIRIANAKEYNEKLKEKLREEVEEFLESENVEELADILEVIDAICKLKKISKNKLKLLQKKKRKERGGFEKRIILLEVK
jgi:predicted house-cleaning noncanonical NTP pyrophosphatase (MazG superfamily)